MNLKELDLDLAVHAGVVDLKLKSPGVRADINFDQAAYEASLPKPLEMAPGAAPPCTPSPGGLGTSPSFTLEEAMVMLSFLGQGLSFIKGKRDQLAEKMAGDDEDDGEGEPVDPEQPHIPSDAR